MLGDFGQVVIMVRLYHLHKSNFSICFIFFMPSIWHVLVCVCVCFKSCVCVHTSYSLRICFCWLEQKQMNCGDR